MIKNKTILEIKKGDRTYELMCSPDSPLGELYDVLLELKSFVFHKLKESESNNESCCKKEECCS